MRSLASLTLTLFALGALVLLLAMGVILAQVRPYSGLMTAMDGGLILDWLLTETDGRSGSTLLRIWFLGLCAAVGLLVVNLCACTWTRLLKRLRNGVRLHAWLLVLAHALMVLILLGHLSQMTLGFKEEGIRLLPGQSRELPGGRRLTVLDVRYLNDPAILNLTYRQARRAHTVAAFSREGNSARVALRSGAGRTAEGEVRIMDPLLTGGMRLTLSDFFRDDSGAEPRVGAVFTAAYNPLTRLFFAAYLAWVAVYLLLAGRAFLRRGGCHPAETRFQPGPGSCTGREGVTGPPRPVEGSASIRSIPTRG